MKEIVRFSLGLLLRYRAVLIAPAVLAAGVVVVVSVLYAPPGVWGLAAFVASVAFVAISLYEAIQ